MRKPEPPGARQPTVFKMWVLSARPLCRSDPSLQPLADRRAFKSVRERHNFQKCLVGSIARVLQLDEYRQRAIGSQATPSPARAGW
jgi:hypothetical protein